MGRKNESRSSRYAEPMMLWEMPQSDTGKEKQKARELRHSAWWRQKTARGKCYYCGNTVKPSELTMDHIIPLSRGGRSEKMNIVAACKDCNNRKKHMLPAEWEEYLALLGGSSDAPCVPQEEENG